MCVCSYAPGYYSAPGSFINHEFTKHGSCVGGYLAENQTAFFEQAGPMPALHACGQHFCERYGMYGGASSSSADCKNEHKTAELAQGLGTDSRTCWCTLISHHAANSTGRGPDSMPAAGGHPCSQCDQARDPCLHPDPQQQGPLGGPGCL